MSWQPLMRDDESVWLLAELLSCQARVFSKYLGGLGLGVFSVLGVEEEDSSAFSF